jgi:lipid-A-disaccharide synthase
MIEAASQLHPSCEFLLPLAPTLTPEHIDQVRAMLPANGPRIILVDDARTTLYHARASVVASGTATVEAALIGNPFIVVYRVSKVTYSVARRVVKVPYVAMVNLIAGREVVPELIQDDFTAANVVSHLQNLLCDEAVRSRIQADLAKVGASLHSARSPIEQVAGITMELMGSAR